MVYSSERFKAVVPVLVLLFVALWFILRGDLSYVLTWCYFVLVFFSPLSIAITSLEEGRASLNAFRTFVRFVLVWFYRFPLPLDVCKELWFEIVALPGLFSCLFYTVSPVRNLSFSEKTMHRHYLPSKVKIHSILLSAFIL